MQAAGSEQREKLKEPLDAWRHLLWRQHAELIGVDGKRSADKDQAEELYKDDRAARAVGVKSNG